MMPLLLSLRYTQHHAWKNNKKSDDAKHFGEDEETNSISLNALIGCRSTGKKTTIVWTKGLRKIMKRVTLSYISLIIM